MLHELDQGKGSQSKVVASQSEKGEANDQGEYDGCEARSDKGDIEGQTLVPEDAEGVGTDSEKADVPHVYVTDVSPQ